MKRIQGFPSCFGCGADNPRGLRLDLRAGGGRVVTLCRLPEGCEGFPGIAHGGVLAALLDEVMAWAAVEASGLLCLTGELNVRYLRPVPLGGLLRAWGELVATEGRSFLCRGQIESAGGETLVTGEGKFFPGSPEASRQA